ncbi:MAG TPA: hypothetical protein VG501_07165 [Rhizomicrobium sp.]|nr:hypothetical protein [Rhizomicrobium sp.]
MSVVDKTGAAPETRNVSFLLLLSGATAAPIFWIGQLMLGYIVSAYRCYPGDHPVPISFAHTLYSTLLSFDIVAVIAALAGGVVSFWCWRHIGRESREAVNFHVGQGRVRFLALWGIFSSLWFFFAILFNTIGSLTVPPCLT